LVLSISLASVDFAE
jgi:hypothetical protein